MPIPPNSDQVDCNKMGDTIEEFEFNGNTIPPPSNSKIYQPIEAAKLITSLTGKHTKERGQLINLILSKKAVKGRTALYDTIKAYEGGRPFSVVWKERNRKRSSPHHNEVSARNNLPLQPPNKLMRIVDQANDGRRTGCLIDRESMNSIHWGVDKHREKDGWRGSIYLDVTCISVQDIKHGLLSKEVLTKPSRRNICDALGKGVRVDGDNNDEIRYIYDRLVENGKIPARLYFSPIEFPPPTDNMDEGGSNDTFSRLKNYIIVSSGSLENGSNSPVVCKGGDRKYRNKVFRCKHYNKHSYCPLNFTISWDEYGYFIRLSNGSLFTFGCQWHCCRTEENKTCKICYEVHLPRIKLEQHMKTCKRKRLMERIRSGELKECDTCGWRLPPLATYEIKDPWSRPLMCSCKAPVVRPLFYYEDKQKYLKWREKYHKPTGEVSLNPKGSIAYR